jgi:hypothetical protein
LMESQHCDRCGSAGSIEFEMCQVCFKDYSKVAEGKARVLKFSNYGPRKENIINLPPFLSENERVAKAFSA